MIKIGDKVYTTVSVAGRTVRMSPGIVVDQTFDRSVSSVDIMSLHGGRPWVRLEATSNLILFDEVIDER